jgi:predicted MFS family arabinose efflux permease
LTDALRTPRLLVALGGLHFVLFPIPIVTLFWKDQIGLSLTDIMTLQAIFGLASVVIEFPSGYLADRVGYRAALLTGAVLWTVGWAFYARATTFTSVALAEVVLGAGHAFVSGADAALLFSWLAARNDIGNYTRWEGRVRAAGQACEAGSSALGGWLYGTAPRLPFWLQTPIALAAVATVMMMGEPPRAPAVSTTSHGARMWHVLRYALGHPRLRTAIAASVVLGSATFVMVWLIQPWMQRRGIPVAWFGPIWAAAHLWLAAVSLTSARFAEAFGVRTTLVVCAGLVVVGYVLLATFAAAQAVVFYLCFMTTRGLQSPVLTTVIQADAPQNDRASVLSLNALCFRLAFVICGPAVGMLVDARGLEPALGILAAAFALLSAATIRARHLGGGIRSPVGGDDPRVPSRPQRHHLKSLPICSSERIAGAGGRTGVI